MQFRVFFIKCHLWCCITRWIPEFKFTLSSISTSSVREYDVPFVCWWVNLTSIAGNWAEATYSVLLVSILTSLHIHNPCKHTVLYQVDKVFTCSSNVQKCLVFLVWKTNSMTISYRHETIKYMPSHLVAKWLRWKETTHIWCREGCTHNTLQCTYMPIRYTQSGAWLEQRLTQTTTTTTHTHTNTHVHTHTCTHTHTHAHTHAHTHTQTYSTRVSCTWVITWNPFTSIIQITITTTSAK